MKKSDKIFVAGHRGLVGSAVLRALISSGYENLITKTRSELDLLDFAAVNDFFAAVHPEYIFLCAAKVGGILANNTARADFLYENLAIQNHVITAAHRYGAKKLLFLGSSCIYPKFSQIPIAEDALLTGALEFTNEPYAIAKIAGLKLIEALNLQYHTNFIALMPCNLYGENDNFNLQTSHVLPAFIAKLHAAKIRGDSAIKFFGTGRALREFLHADDLARACIFAMENVDFEDIVKNLHDKTTIRNTHLNVGSGQEISIQDLARLVADVVGFSGEILFDTPDPKNPEKFAKNDGTMRKLLDSSKIKALGFEPEISLRAGVARTYEWYQKTGPRG